MARQAGTLKLGSNLEIRTNAPADAREKVLLKADLTDPASFPYFWVGMQVFVEEEKKRYTLMEEDPTDINSWELEAASAGGDATLQQGITVGEAVGGLTAGKTFAKGDDLESILREMLDPLKYPTLTPPSLSLAASGGTIFEKGTSTTVTLNATFNQGKIEPAYGTNGKRSGPVTEYTLGAVTNTTGQFTDVAVDETNKSFTASASYEDGPQPKDSHGGNFDVPLTANSVNSNTVTFQFVYCFYSNKDNIASLAKHAPTTSKVFEMRYPPQTAANPEKFAIPAAWTVSKLEVLNDLSGKFEDVSSEFTVTDVTMQDAAGNDVAYKLYTDNRGYAAADRTIKVTIA